MLPLWDRKRHPASQSRRGREVQWPLWKDSQLTPWDMGVPLGFLGPKPTVGTTTALSIPPPGRSVGASTRTFPPWGPRLQSLSSVHGIVRVPKNTEKSGNLG